MIFCWLSNVGNIGTEHTGPILGKAGEIEDVLLPSLPCKVSISLSPLFETAGLDTILGKNFGAEAKNSLDRRSDPDEILILQDRIATVFKVPEDDERGPRAVSNLKKRFPLPGVEFLLIFDAGQKRQLGNDLYARTKFIRMNFTEVDWP